MLMTQSVLGLSFFFFWIDEVIEDINWSWWWFEIWQDDFLAGFLLIFISVSVLADYDNSYSRIYTNSYLDEIRPGVINFNNPVAICQVYSHFACLSQVCNHFSSCTLESGVPICTSLFLDRSVHPLFCSFQLSYQIIDSITP
jgi:hypothetical protein